MTALHPRLVEFDPASAAVLLAALGFLASSDLAVEYWVSEDDHGVRRSMTHETRLPIDGAFSWGLIRIVDRLHVTKGRWFIWIVTCGTGGGRSEEARSTQEAVMGNSRRSRPTNREEQLLRVKAGRVVCPRRGVIDLELCFVCAYFGGFQQGITEGLVCGYGSVLGISDFDRGMDVAPWPDRDQPYYCGRRARASGRSPRSRRAAP